MVLVDLRPKGVKGHDAERALERAGLTCNKNAIPFDPEKPLRHLWRPPRHLRRHHRGFGEAEFAQVGELVLRSWMPLAATAPPSQPSKPEVLAQRGPIYALKADAPSPYRFCP